MKRRLRLVATVFLVAVLLLLLGQSMIRQMLYPAPPIPVYRPPSPLTEEVLDLGLQGEAVAWAYEHPAEDAATPAVPAVLFFHGNGENLETLRHAGVYDELARIGVHFLAVDYPGYGRSGGRPSEASLVAAGRAGLLRLAERHPESPKVVLGWSLGAAVAIQTAAEGAVPVDGLVLLSPWDDLLSLAAVHFPRWLVRLALRDRYDSSAAAAAVRCPTLVIHGGLDPIIPIVHGRRLQAALTSPSRFVEVPEAGHNDLLARSVVWRELASFLRQLPER